MTETVMENIKTNWLGDYPLHWYVIRIKNIFREMDSRSETGNEELLSVSHYTGVTLKRESLENEDDNITNAETLVGYKKVAGGDLVINIMLAWNGSLGISPFDGITSPAYCVYRCNPEYNPEYFGYLFSTNLFKAEFRRNSTGIIESRLRLYSDKFFSIFSVVPPKEEQDEIVAHIKTQSQKINRFTQKKQRFIVLLKEQRQSIVNQTVTKGIDANVKMKPSGVEWLGDVPKHWEVRRLKNFCKTFSGATPESAVSKYWGGDIYWITPADFGDKMFIEDSERKITVEGLNSCAATLVPVGSIIISSRAPIGSLGITRVELCTNQGCKSLVPEKINNYFLYYFLSTQTEILNVIGNGTTFKELSITSLRDFKIPYPPIEEQQDIISHIKTETQTLDTAITKAEKEIELIKEYKEAMIAEAVMGKINQN